jgi:ribonuclease-3
MTEVVVLIKKLEDKINYSFRDERLLEEALTHRSYLNENLGVGISHNERLEFLGDAVLELAVTEDLYARFPQYEEGTLTSFRAALVNYIMLSGIAREIGLDGFLRLSKGEAKDTGRAREVILANAMEALIGAIYLDSGYSSAKAFVLKIVMPHLKEVMEKETYRDPKSTLQEKTQADMKITPVYRLISEEGPDHAKVFKMGVYLGDNLVATGTGASKQEAEIEAAKSALTKLY